MRFFSIYFLFLSFLFAQSDGYLGNPGNDLGKPSGDFGRPSSGVGNPPNLPPSSNGEVPAFGTPNHQNPYINRGGGYGKPGHSGGIQHAPNGHGGRR